MAKKLETCLEIVALNTMVIKIGADTTTLRGSKHMKCAALAEEVKRTMTSL